MNSIHILYIPNLYTIYYRFIHILVIAMSTTIRVSLRNAKKLEELKRRLGARSIDEVISILIRERRIALAKELFGVDKGRISSFEEKDRLDSRV